MIDLTTPRPICISADSHSELLVRTLRCLLDYNYHIQRGVPNGPNNKVTLEREDVTLELRNPWDWCLDVPERNDCLAATMFEASWALSGNNDIAPLSHYLPRAANYSDDGLTWRAGYGPRLRNLEVEVLRREGFPAAVTYYDQLEHVVKLLTADPLSRRAIILIAVPEDQAFAQESLDFPCNLVLHVLLSPMNGPNDKNYTLSLKGFQRSMDALWGMNINIVTWCWLMHCLADRLSLSLGTRVVPGRLTHHVSSLHLYSDHVERARKIVNSVDLDSPLVKLGYPISPAPTLDSVRQIVSDGKNFQASKQLEIPLSGVRKEFLLLARTVLAIYYGENVADNLKVLQCVAPSIYSNQLAFAKRTGKL